MNFQDFLKEGKEPATHPVFKKGDDTTSHVKMSLHRSGYGIDDLHSSNFSHVSPKGDEVHEIHFPNPETGKPDKGHVYIDKNGKAEY